MLEMMNIICFVQILINYLGQQNLLYLMFSEGTVYHCGSVLNIVRGLHQCMFIDETIS